MPELNAKPARVKVKRRLRHLGEIVYLAIIQGSVGLIWFLLGTYLALNSPSTAALASDLITRLLPGSIAVQYLHIGPVVADGELRVRLRAQALALREPGGVELLGAARAEVDIAPARLIDGLRGGALRLTLPRIVLDRPRLRIDNDKLGRLRLTQIFADPNEPPKPDKKPMPVYLHVGHVEVQDARYIMDIPAMWVDARGLWFDSPGASVTIVPGQPPDIQYEIKHIVSVRTDMTLDSMRQLPAIPAASLQVDSVSGTLNSALVAGLNCQMPPVSLGDPLAPPQMALSRSRIAVQWLPEVVVHGDRILMTASAKSPFIAKMLGPLFDADAQVDGQFHFDLRDGFWTEGTLLGRGLMSGFHTEAVRGKVRVETGPRGDSLVRVRATDVEVACYGGTIRSPRIDYRMDAEKPEHVTMARFDIDHIRGEAPLLDEAIRLTGITPVLASGQLSGSLGTWVRVNLPKGKKLDMDCALDADLTLLRDEPLAALRQQLPKVQWKGGMRYAMGPDIGLRVDFDRSDMQTDSAHHGGEKTAALLLDGRLDLSGDDSHLAVDLDIPRLEDWLQPLGIEGVSGSLRVDDGHVGGQLLAPGVVGRMTVDNLTSAGYLVRHGQAQLKLQGGSLSLAGLRATTDVGQISGDIEMGLFGKDLTVMATSQLMTIRNLAVSQVDLAKLLGRWHLTGISGQGELSHGTLRADLKNFMPTLQFSGDVALQNIKAYGESFDRATAQVGMAHQAAELQNARLRLRGLPADGSADIAISGRYDLGRRHVEADLAMPALEFKRFSSLEKLPLGGKIGLTAKVSGEGRHLVLSAGLDLIDLSWGKLSAGTAHIDLDKAADGALLMKSDNFFESLRLLPGTEVKFAGWSPTEATLKLGTIGSLDPFERLGLDRPQGIGLRVEGEVAVMMGLKPGNFSWAVDAVVPAAGLWLDPGGGARPIRNTNDAVVHLTQDKIVLENTYLELNRNSIELCGAYLLPKGDEVASVLGFVGGTVDVQRVGALSQSLADLDLRLNILPDGIVASDPRAKCLETVKAGGGALRIEGPVDRARVQGILEMQSGRVALRRFGSDIMLEEGARLQISTSSRGIMNLTIPVEHELRGQIDDGHFSFSGKVTLEDLALDSVQARLWAGDVPFAVPKEYQMLLSPDLTMTGTHLQDPERRNLRLAGDVHISEGSYYRSFDQISSVLGNAGERKVASYSKPITETMPWLAEVGLDLKVHGKNFEVASRVPGGKTDLVTEFDLKVTGDLANLRVHDRLRVVEGSGSQISASVNNLVFEVTSGTLDFNGDVAKPYLDATARTDIPVRAGTRTGTMSSSLGSDLTTDTSQLDEIVQVFVQVKGVFGDRRNFIVHLSSNKGDTETDCMCLIAARRRCNDQGGGAPRLTTDFFFGEALNTVVTGLLKSVVDTVQVDFDPINLGVSADVTKKLGKSIALGTRVQTGKENRYNANFSFRITDRLSLNGLWRRQKLLDSSSAQETSVDVYESKLRYKVPLED